MSIEEYIQKLRKDTDEIASGKPLFEAVSSTLQQMTKRIFTDGYNALGERHQYNDTDELYIDPTTSPGSLTPRGKPEFTVKKINSFTRQVVRKKFGNTQRTVRVNSFTKRVVDHKLTWFESYKAYRAKIGARTDYVNLTLGADLKLDVENSIVRIDNNNYELRVKRDLSAKKMEKFDDKYDTVFVVNRAEEATFQRVYKDEVLRHILGR